LYFLLSVRSLSRSCQNYIGDVVISMLAFLGDKSLKAFVNCYKLKAMGLPHIF